MRHRIPHTSIATQLTKLAPKLAVHAGGCAAGLMESPHFARVLVPVALSLMQRFSRIERIAIGAVMDDLDLGGPKSQNDVAGFATLWSFVTTNPKKPKAAQCAALSMVGPHGLEPWTKGL